MMDDKPRMERWLAWLSNGGVWKPGGGVKFAMPILIPVIVTITIMALLSLISEEINRMLLAEKRIEKRFEMDLLAEQTDRFVRMDNDWDSEHDSYVDSII